jgi:hypothetical protein
VYLVLALDKTEDGTAVVARTKMISRYFSSEDYYEKIGWPDAVQRNAEIDWAGTPEELVQIHEPAARRAMRSTGEGASDATKQAMQRVLAPGKASTRAVLLSFVRVVFFLAASLYHAHHGKLQGFSSESIVVLFGAAYEHARASHGKKAFPATAFLEALSSVFVSLVSDENYTSRTCMCGRRFPPDSDKHESKGGDHGSNHRFYCCNFCLVEDKHGVVQTRKFDKVLVDESGRVFLYTNAAYLALSCRTSWPAVRSSKGPSVFKNLA